MALNERIGPSSRERLTTLAKSIGREEFAMNVLEIPSDKVLDDLADQLAELYDMRSVNEVTRYSGFLKNPPEPTPDSEPFNPTGAVAEFREDLRALFGKYKDELNNRKFIGGVAEIMVNWKSLLRSQMSEEEVDEMSTSGGAGAYLTPYAFRLKGKKPNIKAYKELGYEEVNENIKNPGATLGPGPAASEDGVKDNYYVKAFKFKLVPKKIKDSGIIVKQLF